jgi:DNA-binding MarR family transcriptional regulator
MSLPSEKVIDAWIRLMRAPQAVLAAMEARVKAAELPPLTWYDALWALERAAPKGLRPADLEREMLLAQYGVSRLLDRLESAGYIERRPVPEDKRGQTIMLTPAGRATRRRIWPVYARAIQETIGSRLTDQEATELTRLLGKLG